MNAAAATTTTTIKFAEIVGELYATLTNSLSHDEDCIRDIREYAGTDYAVVAPHATVLCAERRIAFSTQVMVTFPVSVTLGGDVIGVPEDAVKVVLPALKGILHDVTVTMNTKILTIIKEAKA